MVEIFMITFRNTLSYLITGVFLGLLIISRNLSVSLAFAIGLPLLIGAFLSLDFGVALLMTIVILFKRDQLFSVSLPLFGGGLKPTDMLFLSIMSGWLMRTGFSRKRLIGHSDAIPLFIFLLLFVIWAVCCAAIGLINGHFYKYSILELRPLVYYLLAIPIISEFDINKVKRIIHIIIIASTVISIKALIYYQLGIGEPATYTGNDIRIMSVEFSYILFSFLLCICLYIETNKHILLGPLVITLIGLVTTFQRSAFVGLAVGVLAIIIIAKHYSTIFTLSVFLFMACVFTYGYMNMSTEPTGMFQALTDRLVSISSYRSDLSAQHRFQEWKAAIKDIELHPVIGNGLGYVITFYSPMYSPDEHKYGFLSENIYVHNSYVWVCLKMGIIGVILFLSMILAFMKYGWMSIGVYRNRSGYGYVLGLVTSVVSLSVVSFFGPMFNVDNVSPFVGFAFGAVAVSLAQLTEGKAERARTLSGGFINNAEGHSTA
jgi:hypothetical protein